MQLPQTPAAIIPSQCVLGEGPVWDDVQQCLWFTDIQQSLLLRWDHKGGRLDRFSLPERLGSIALSDDPDVLVLALASGFACFRPATDHLAWLHRIEPVYRGIRMNDGRVDRQGRFWAGSMVEDAGLAPPEAGSLYRLDPPGRAPPAVLRQGIAIANSTCFSPDGQWAYFADTPTRQIRRHATNGDFGHGRLFVEIEGDGWPDGSDVDAAGRLWNAEWGGARISVYHPDGGLAARLPLPVSQPTCVAFGGADFTTLFVTSAREGLSADTEPQAGNVLVFEGVPPGLPANRFPLSAARG